MVVNETLIHYQNVWCLYPVSGAYTRVQRILFYITIAVAFLFRTHKWISSVAIGSAFVYSLVAAVQSIPMSVQSSLGADPDFIALYIIVITSLYAAVMARMYSPRFIGRNFDAIYNWWIIIFFLLTLFLDYAFNRFTYSTSDHILQLACPDSSSCPDPCADHNPHVLFRGGQFDSTTGVVLSSWSASVPSNGTNQNATIGPPTVGGNGQVDGYQIKYSALQIFEIIALYPLTILGQRNQYRPPRLTRNKAFRRLRLKRVMSSSGGTTSTTFTFRLVYAIHIFWLGLTYLVPEIDFVKSGIQRGLRAVRLNWSAQGWIYERSNLEEVNTKSRENYAKNIAFLWYILCMLSYVALPIFLVSLTIKLERLWLGEIPESEGIQAIGQWGPIVGLAITLILAALFRWSTPEPESHSYKELAEGEYDPFAYEPSQTKQAWYWKYRALAAPVNEWNDLNNWLRNPTSASQEIEHREQSEPIEQPPRVTADPADPSDDTVQLLPIEQRHIRNHNTL
ncbi:hypothetical protein F5Y01DRAFT_296848 [Xylaria sp. FL0043]|nr:hypothetical protein F5Y01DRAFT_296848 [Xylaria sp. FL0043]